jgi:hypothetical protein
MRSRNIDAHSAARIRLIIREAVRARMGLLNEADGNTLAASWFSDGSLTVTTDFLASRIVISRFKDGKEGTQINAWKDLQAGSYQLLDAASAEAQSRDAEGILVRATPNAEDAEPKVVTIKFADRPKTATAAPAAGTATATDAAPAGEKAAPADTKAADSAAADADSDGDEPGEPHAAAGDVQDLARRGLRAVKKGFADEDEEADNTVKIADLPPPPSGHKWLTNEERGEELDDWQMGDEYTYIALVSEGEDPKPVLFVVSGDPEDNNHHSTGYILAPDSRQPLHRKAFCILYKRATGETHPSCVPGGGGSSRRPGSGDGSGSKYVGSSRDMVPGGRSTRAKLKGDQITSGSGDIDDVSGFNRARERIYGKRFYSRSDQGFDLMGPGGTATPAALRRKGKKNGDVPKTIVVVFRYPIVIDPNKVVQSEDGEQTVSLANSSLGRNRTAEDITSIGFYYKTAANNLRALVSLGVPRSPRKWWGGKFTRKNDPEAFDIAAAWIFANPQQFDLAEDIEFHDARPVDSEKKGTSDTAQKAGSGGELGTGGASAADVEAYTGQKSQKEGLNESRRTPLLDRYRF